MFESPKKSISGAIAAGAAAAFGFAFFLLFDVVCGGVEAAVEAAGAASGSACKGLRGSLRVAADAARGGDATADGDAEVAVWAAVARESGLGMRAAKSPAAADTEATPCVRASWPCCSTWRMRMKTLGTAGASTEESESMPFGAAPTRSAYAGGDAERCRGGVAGALGLCTGFACAAPPEGGGLALVPGCAPPCSGPNVQGLDKQLRRAHMA